MIESFEGRNVLLVEDNPFEIKLLLGVLQAFEFRKIIAHDNVDDAIAELSHSTVDCVLLDWMLPGKPGIELVRFVRRSEQDFSPDLPIVLCTGYTEMAKITLARDAGVDEIVAKPFSVDGLYQRLYSAIFKQRPFVAVDEYSGPDRRRREQSFQGTDRRGERGMSQDQIDALMTPDKARNIGSGEAQTP